MGLFYDLLIYVSEKLLRLIAAFRPKIARFVKGRENLIPRLRENLTTDSKVIWMHAASLGEYEQGLPILEALRRDYPNHTLLLTFFSPSGYEVKHMTAHADVVSYLPLDRKSKVKAFLDATKPVLALFIKYEIWPNYLTALDQRNIPSILFSAVFKKEQAYFKTYGTFMRKALLRFDHVFVQDKSSRDLLATIGYQKVTVAGDTRIDRVSKVLSANTTLPFMEAFLDGQSCFVAGSTWPKDTEALLPFLNDTDHRLKTVLAPHNINEKEIAAMEHKLQKRTLRYTHMGKAKVVDADILILDTIGLLSQVYRYADFAYVGGGFGTGLHNTLEPAVFGIPIVIGPQYSGFMEAEYLVEDGGIRTIIDSESAHQVLSKLTMDPEYRALLGAINRQYTKTNQGSSALILDHLETLLNP